ncbi:MAG: hypothetical protein JO347_12915, partial [Candidatus Eremiobacteraeota bacterium]|nr:hypothetical protein [Candidatus Eremiobacteraeota bacterium]
MSLEVVNTVAAAVTALVIAATAILALIQLRHLRAGNQIAGFMTLRNMLDDDAHQRAMATMVTEGDLTTEQGFREYVAARAAGQVP